MWRVFIIHVFEQAFADASNRHGCLEARHILFCVGMRRGNAWKLEMSGEILMRKPKVTASGLPKGITLADLGNGRWGFRGFTAKAGTYCVRLKATGNGLTASQFLALKVAGLPAWAKGKYAGPVLAADGTDCGQATVRVSSSGRISGRMRDRGMSWTFGAPGYADFDADAPCCSAKVTAKSGCGTKNGGKAASKHGTRTFTLRVTPGKTGGEMTLATKDGVFATLRQ